MIIDTTKIQDVNSFYVVESLKRGLWNYMGAYYHFDSCIENHDHILKSNVELLEPVSWLT